MNLNPFIDLLGNVISLYEMLVVAWIVIFWLMEFGIVNRNNKVVARFIMICKKLVEPVTDYIGRFIPMIAGIDLSPIVLFLLLSFTKNILYTYCYSA